MYLPVTKPERLYQCGTWSIVYPPLYTKNQMEKPMVKEDWSKIKHFKPEEFLCNCQNCDNEKGISFLLVELLDNMRSKLGFPMSINSGYRCTMHPLSRNSTSSHIKGLAVDVSCKNSGNRFTILEYVLKHGLFHRMGVGSDFIHLDIDNDKDQRVTWVY